MESGARPRRIPLAVLPTIVAPLLLAMPFFGGEVLLFRDILHFNLPQQVFAAAARAALRFPEWTPLLYGGTPFFAEPGTGFLYPPNLVFHLFSPERAATAFVLLHLPLAGASTCYAARVLGLKELGAAVSGCAFVTCGYLLSMHGEHYYVASTALLPLLFGLLVRLGRPHGRGPLVGAALVITLMVFNGELQSLLLGGLLALPFLLLEPARWKALTSVAIAIGCGALMSGLQLLPMALFAADSVRGEGLSLEEASRWSLHPLRWLELLAPHPWGIPYPDNSFWGTALLHGDAFTLPLVTSLYLGAPVVLLALGVAWRGNKELRVLLGSALVALLLAAGAFTPLFALWFRLFPLVNRFRYPEKYAAAATLALVLAAGFGVEALAKEWRRFAILGGAAALLLPIVGWGLRPSFAELEAGLRAAGAVASPAEALAQFQGAFTHGALLAAALGALAVLSRGRPGLAGLLLVLVVLCDGASTNLSLLSYGDASFMRKPPQIVAALQVSGGRFIRDRACHFRDTSEEGTLLERKRRWEWETGKENFLTLFGLGDCLGYGAALPRQKLQLVHELGGLNDRVLKILGASSSVSCARGVTVVPVAAPLARVAVVEPLRLAASEIPGRLADPFFDLDRTALLEEDAPPAGEGVRRAIIEREIPEQVQIRTEGAGGLLRLTEAWGRGWTVTVDGAEARLLRSDLQWRAVAVPAGTHTIVFRYRTPGLFAGALLSLVGTVALALSAARKRAVAATP